MLLTMRHGPHLCNLFCLLGKLGTCLIKVEQILLPAPSQTTLNLLPPFYHSVMVLWYQLSRRMENGTIFVEGRSTSCPISSLTVRFVYRQLLRLYCPLHPCVERYRSWGFVVEWDTVWSNLHLWRFVHLVRDTNWLIAHGILPTTDLLAPFGMSVDPEGHCGAVETLIHLFTRCPVALRVFAWYQSIVHHAVPTSVQPSPSQLLVGYDRSVQIPPVFPCLLGIIRHHLWVACNAYRFDGSPVVYQLLLTSVKSSLRFVVRLQQRHCLCDLFVELWLAAGVLGYVSNENIIVFSQEYQ